MTVDKVLLYYNTKGDFKESDIKETEKKLAELGIASVRWVQGDHQEFDAVISLGGDGSMLNASKLAFPLGKPIISVNYGTLGYMCGLEKSELDMLSHLKTGFETEKRMLLNVEVFRGDVIIGGGIALNEAVVARNSDGGIANLNLKCDGADVYAYRGDGMIIATPTGSSAYCMSAGGPIIDTKLEAICVCPICPHALNSRAMVFSPNSVLEVISLNHEDRGENLLLIDGKKICNLKGGDRVTVRKSKESLDIIKLKEDAFYETLYKKMS